MIFEITDHSGTTHTFTAPSPEAVTVAEWVRLTIPPMQNASTFREELEYNIQLAKRFAGIPDTLLRRMPMSELKRLMEAIGHIGDMAAEARKEDVSIPDTFTHEGVTYVVPKDPGTAITFGQYMSVLQQLEGYKYQDESIAVVLACILREEGKEWSTEGLEDRIEAMKRLPARLAITLSAFFFDGSKELRIAWERCMSQKLTSKLRAVQQALSPLATGTATTSPSA